MKLHWKKLGMWFSPRSVCDTREEEVGESADDKITYNSFIVTDSSEAALKEATGVILSKVSVLH